MNIKRFMKAMVFLLAMALLTFAAALLTMKAFTYSGTVVVPDLSGKDLASAITLLRATGLDIKVDRQEHHPSVPAGSVIQQNPLPGTTVKKGRNVSVVASLGSEEVTVPALTGDVFRRVQMVLKQAGLTLGDVARARSDAQTDVVLAQDPQAQAVIQKGERVDLLVSGGPSLARFMTPDLAGKTLPEAEAAMKPMAVVVAASGKGAAVVSQAPKPGYPVQAGGTLDVVLGAAPQTGGPITVQPAPKPQAPAPPAPLLNPVAPKEDKP
jgi:beta-lactam-binding protein with PASTA domain